jgi:Kef-type K+ transport system membrane component KefB/mannitol/fructose-specific phosphotransferase system IIA component (Ntr-type)
VSLPITDPVVVVAIVAGIIVASPLILERYGVPGMIGILVAGAVLGENALGILARDQAIVLLGTMGLIYIMFAAALEIDLAILKRSRVQSIGFGLLTFALPQVVGTLVFRFLLGFPWPAAILVASMFASHTLLAYPVASRLGLAKHKAVTATLGATIVTDTLALLVLAVIASTADGELSREFWLTLGLSMAVFVAGVFILVPLLARWFFRHIKPDGSGEFVFVLATVFTCAGLSHSAGLEPIIGAFLAGLALNRSIPHSSILMNRITFTGDALFVPFFLLSVGMLLDVRIFFGGLRSWLISIAMVGCVIVTKFAAAEAARLLFRYKATEAKVMFGLSLAQAAATLAVVMVGVSLTIPGQEEPGIFYPYNSEVLNGAILMMLVTCIMAPIIVSRHGRKLALAQERMAVGDGFAPQRILVALAKAETAPPLLDLGLLLRDDGQQQPIYPFTVVRDGGAAGFALGKKAVAYAEKMLSRAVVHCTSADVPAHPLTRIDVNVVSALGRARRELRITDILIGWSPRTTEDRIFGSSLDHLLEDRECTIWRARFQHPVNATRRVLFCVPPHALQEPGFASVASAVKLLANRLGAKLVVWATTMEGPALSRSLNALKPEIDHEVKTVDGWSVLAHDLGGKVSDLDLLVLYGARPGSLSHSPAVARVPNRIAGRFQNVNLLVVYPSNPPEAIEAPLGTERADAQSFLREEQIVFGLGNLSFADAIATVIEEGLAAQKTAAPAAPEHLVLDLLSSATEIVPGIALLTATADIEEPLVLTGASSQGIDREGDDPAHLIFVVLAPPDQESQAHLDRLADVAHLGRAAGLVDQVRAASGPGDVLAALDAAAPRRQTASFAAVRPPASGAIGS